MDYGLLYCRYCGEWFYEDEALGAHRGADPEDVYPYNQPHCMTGREMLWLGWTQGYRGCWLQPRVNMPSISPEHVQEILSRPKPPALVLPDGDERATY